MAHRKDPKVLNARGSFKKHPERKRNDPPENTNPVGAPPEHLTEAAGKIWFEFCECAPPAMLSEADRPILAMACRNEALIRHLYRIIYAPDAGGQEKAMAMVNAKEARQLSYLARLGMTPTDRLRFSAPPSKDANEFDCLD